MKRPDDASWSTYNKIVPDGITVRLAHFVVQNVNLALLSKFRAHQSRPES